MPVCKSRRSASISVFCAVAGKCQVEGDWIDRRTASYWTLSAPSWDARPQPPSRGCHAKHERGVCVWVCVCECRDGCNKTTTRPESQTNAGRENFYMLNRKDFYDSNVIVSNLTERPVFQACTYLQPIIMLEGDRWYWSHRWNWDNVQLYFAWSEDFTELPFAKFRFTMLKTDYEQSPEVKYFHSRGFLYKKTCKHLRKKETLTYFWVNA